MEEMYAFTSNLLTILSTVKEHKEPQKFKSMVECGSDVVCRVGGRNRNSEKRAILYRLWSTKTIPYDKYVTNHLS
jgi:hypothetical protein